MKLAGLTAAVCILCVAWASRGQTQWVRLDSVAASSEPASGYWRVAPEGALFLCQPRPGHSGSYNLTLLFSPDLSIRPGTFFGTMAPTGKTGVFDAELMLDPSKFNRREHRRTFTIEMNETTDKMIFKAYHDRLTVNFGRLLPYFFRISVRRDKTRPENIDGAVRIDGSDLFADKIVIL